jgi:hypothetical protein
VYEAEKPNFQPAEDDNGGLAAKKSLRPRYNISEDEDEEAPPQGQDLPPSYKSSAGDEKITASQSRSLIQERLDVSASNVSSGKQVDGTALSVDLQVIVAMDSVKRTRGNFVSH